MNESAGARMNSGCVRVARVRLFLHEILDAVRGRLQPPAASTDAIRAAAVLDPRGDLALGEGEQCRTPTM